MAADFLHKKPDVAGFCAQIVSQAATGMPRRRYQP
jgi:hypothetical protein